MPSKPAAKPAENVDESVEAASIESSWVFIDRPATVPEVTALLASAEVPYTRGQHGPSKDGMTVGPELEPITMERYLPYVLPMVNNQKVKRDKVTTYVEATTLYTQVAGRLAMLNDVATRNGWTVDIYPAKDTPTGADGYLRMDDVLLFRVFIEISKDGQSLGRKFGTAGGKATGGSNAEGTNPFETVETSALGRALAQWGFGVLPGSGIASVEEMRLAQSNERAQRQQGSRPAAQPAEPDEDRGTLIASALEFNERLRKMRGSTEEEANTGLGSWVLSTFGIADFIGEDQSYEWGKLADNQIRFMRNKLRDFAMQAAASGQEHP